MRVMTPSLQQGSRRPADPACRLGHRRLLRHSPSARHLPARRRPSASCRTPSWPPSSGSSIRRPIPPSWHEGGVIGAWLDGELVGTASWQANAPSGARRPHRLRFSCATPASASAAGCLPRSRRAPSSVASAASPSASRPTPCRSSSGTAMRSPRTASRRCRRLRAAGDVPAQGLTARPARTSRLRSNVTALAQRRLPRTPRRWLPTWRWSVPQQPPSTLICGCRRTQRAVLGRRARPDRRRRGRAPR